MKTFIVITLIFLSCVIGYRLAMHKCINILHNKKKKLKNILNKKASIILSNQIILANKHSKSLDVIQNYNVVVFNESDLENFRKSLCLESEIIQGLIAEMFLEIDN